MSNSSFCSFDTSGVEFVNCCGCVRCRIHVFGVFLVHQMSNSSIVVGASVVEFIMFVFVVDQVSNSAICVDASGVEFIFLCVLYIRCRIRQLL
jgi:hypothetical protein